MPTPTGIRSTDQWSTLRIQHHQCHQTVLLLVWAPYMWTTVLRSYPFPPSIDHNWRLLGAPKKPQPSKTKKKKTPPKTPTRLTSGIMTPNPNKPQPNQQVLGFNSSPFPRFFVPQNGDEMFAHLCLADAAFFFSISKTPHFIRGNVDPDDKWLYENLPMCGNNYTGQIGEVKSGF